MLALGTLTIAVAACPVSLRSAIGAEAASVDPAVAQEVRAAIEQLDAEDFATRSKAAERLTRRVAEPALAEFLSEEFARTLLASETSFEVRSQLESLARPLKPVAPPANEPRPRATDLGPLLDQLNSNTSSQRDSARRRIQSMLGDVESIAPVYVELKRRVANRQLAAEGRYVLEPLLDQARRAWLAAEPARVALPAVTNDQITAWVDELTKLDDAEPADRTRREAADRELLDAICRDEVRPRVLEILAQRIAAASDAASSTTLQNLADFARPAMAAEVWSNRINGTVQYLLIGVPQFNERSPRPTHFDRIDDQTAHCVSGASLIEGDYPVRVALPHPIPQEVMFHLTNLPTPRLRLRYQYDVERDDATRLRELSQRTVDYYLAQKRPLDEGQVLVLSQLDPRIVSRFVGPYFQAVPNQPLLTTPSGELGRLSTLHAAICYPLTRFGTHEAVPALEQLARGGQLGKQTSENPFQIAWIAALSIAQRDPWPEVDTWLASLLDDTTPLAVSIDPRPLLGATAAAVLLDRHGASMQSFGLDMTAEANFGASRFIGYRYVSDKDRQDIRRWWENFKKAKAAEPAP
jgi:hypothetical protein